ncbi:electron transfer flavoprotein subunit alpha/FixB family protein [Clostridium isatidis]|uniref:Electron transfer flavoprotein subunit alpha n=1 Tax=Clostridium isatidis TaxID=182773 RepID=A0A343JEK2_9CLOT|nr:electron transfer flavoprotein subunit alpha/FixB family protein [Clostridium isatidis]ASW43960.1 electron transfer flavoprotein subunit alpha [Clostridium isatidis]
MGKLVVNQDKIGKIQEVMKICPFGAMEEVEGKLQINSGCKMCKLCVRKGPEGAFEFVEEEKPSIDKSLWKGIAVYVDHVDGEIHPVTYELIGKAKELAAKVNHPVYALMLGNDIKDKCREVLHYGVDKVFIYDDKNLARFNIETYTASFEDFVNKLKPTAILVGATPVGRQLAPRLAARLKTGLTADCTILDMTEDTDLVQIRPAFGGNIMAQIVTPNHRPQLATVRYKVMNAPKRNSEEAGEIVECSIEPEKLISNIKVLDIIPKEKEEFIEASDVLIVAGRGIKKEEDLKMIDELAELLGGQVACTRPLAENGWMEVKRQVGLSGRTVRPKLIITCGVSGAVQFTAGMNNAENIIAINKDENAPIFKTAHYGIVGDLYEIIPGLIEQIKMRKEA